MNWMGLAAIEEFKELGEGVGAMGPKRGRCHQTQPVTGLLESKMREFLFKEGHEQVGV